RKACAHDRHGRRIAAVARVERAPRDDRDAHGPEVFAAQDPQRRPGLDGARDGMIYRLEGRDLAAAARHLLDQAGVADTRQRRATRHQCLIELTLRDGRLVAGSREWSAGGDEPCGIPESYVAAQQVAKAHGEEARGDEQHDRESHLGGDKAAPDASVATWTGSPTMR